MSSARCGFGPLLPPLLPVLVLFLLGATASDLKFLGIGAPAMFVVAAAEEPVKSSRAPDLGSASLFVRMLGIQGSDTAAKRSHGLQVIGAGMPKTGTKSLQAALELLGHKIYDLQSISGEGHQDLIYEAFVNLDTDEPWSLFPNVVRDGSAERTQKVRRRAEERITKRNHQLNDTTLSVCVSVCFSVCVSLSLCVSLCVFPCVSVCLCVCPG